jgi:glycosyltransferase involved in cell wall biosynthesis
VNYVLHLTFCASIFFCSATLLHSDSPEKAIVLVMPSWNNIDVCAANLASVFMQDYSNYRVIYIDDCSTDGTGNKVKQLIQEHNQSDRWTVICNEQHRGIMYNHYMAVHLCPNDVIVVNLDGDDQFAHKNALKVINEAYQDDNVWMTYGQYLEWPNKRWPNGKPGSCRKIPPAIQHYHAYRYYDWVTSHVRTFYAGLFKAIPVGYFLHNHEFQPSAVDHAMMYSMLELSKGRAHFIEEVLYWYNCENPNNVFRTMVLTDMAMGYISRGREPLAPLQYDPRNPAVGNTSNARVAVCCFSTREAQRAQLCIDSLKQCSLADQDIYVLYETSTENERQAYGELCARYPHLKVIDVRAGGGLRDQLVSLCNGHTYSHVLVLADDGLIAHPAHIDIHTMIRILEKTHAVGFYMGLGHNVVHQALSNHTAQRPPLIEIEPHIYAWKFNKASAAWRFPYTTDGVLYKMNDFRACVLACMFTDRYTLEQALHMLAAPRLDDVGLCYASAVYVTIA